MSRLTKMCSLAHAGREEFMFTNANALIFLRRLGLGNLYPEVAVGSSESWTRRRSATAESTRPISFWGSSKSDESAKSKTASWNSAISEAEKVVGYTTSFMSLRCLLSDELSNIALQMRKLVGTGHPLLQTARKFLYDGKHNLQTRGLLVLLISKAAGVVEKNGAEMNESMTSGIYPKQRSVAEITEMIHTANLIHKAVVDMSTLRAIDGRLEDMEFGNKMSVLSGDYLLANTAAALAELDNTQVVELMSSAIGDLVEAEFSLPGSTLPTDVPDPSSDHSVADRRETTLAEWQRYTLLGTSLVAKGCQSALMLAGHDPQLQEQAFLFGKHISFARRLHDELLPFTNPSEFSDQISSYSLPVLLHSCLTASSEKTGELTIAQSRKIQTQLCGSEIVDEVREMCRHHGSEAMKALGHFQSSDSTHTLTSMVTAITAL